MYDELLLQDRMAELGLNVPKLAKKAHIDPKTAKKVVTSGTGHPDKVLAVARVLGFTLPEIVKRRSNGNKKTA